MSRRERIVVGAAIFVICVPVAILVYLEAIYVITGEHHSLGILGM